MNETILYPNAMKKAIEAWRLRMAWEALQRVPSYVERPQENDMKRLEKGEPLFPMPPIQ